VPENWHILNNEEVTNLSFFVSKIVSYSSENEEKRLLLVWGNISTLWPCGTTI